MSLAPATTAADIKPCIWEEDRCQSIFFPNTRLN